MKLSATCMSASRMAIAVSLASTAHFAIAPSVMAQDGAGNAQSDDRIVITGSRIVASGLSSPTPVTAIDADQLDNLSPGSLANALDNVPAFFNNSNATTDSSSNVPSARGSNVNLRGLDPSRTLVLLSGRRVVPGSKLGTVNIDLIPQAIVERVDIVTGGASAVYGTDAVAGVVNFVLDDDFEGVRGNIQGGISSRADNENAQFEIAFGKKIGDKMHLIVSGEMFTEEGIQDEDDRGWFNANWGTIINPYGSGPARITVRDLVPTQWTCGGLIIQPGSALDRLDFQPNGTAVPFVFSELSDANNQSVTNGGSGCNVISQSSKDGPQITNDVRRKNLFTYLDYDVTDNFKLYTQFIASKNKTGQSGTGAAFRAPWNITIFRDNAFLPDQIADIMDAEGRTSFRFQKDASLDISEYSKLDIINRTMSITTGFDFTNPADGFMGGWNVNGYFQWGDNRQGNRFFGSAHWQHIIPALDAVVDPDTGEIVCRAALFGNPDFQDCVPLNFFGVGNVSEAGKRYATTPITRDQAVLHQFDLNETVVEAVASGEVWEGWGAGPVSAAFGGSYRKQKIESTCVRGCTDGIFNTDLGLRGIPSGIQGDPDIQYFGSYADVNGGFNVKEAFAEMQVPLISDAPFMQQLTFAPSARWADYSGSGTIWAYKFGLDWMVNNEFRLRGTFSRDVRAATLAERYDRQRAGGTITDDPVTGETYIFSETRGGNPNLNPEKADTITVGAVYQPDWFAGFSATVDYYNITINDAVGRLSTQQIVERCAAGAATLCDLITRDPITNFIVDMENVFINLNEEKAAGIDVELNYRTDVNILGGGAEDMNLRFIGTWLRKRDQVIDGVRTPLVGQIPPGNDIREPAFPEYVATAALTYTNGPFSLFVLERFYNGGKRDLNDVEGIDIDDNSVSKRFYTDARVAYSTGAWEFYLQGINLTDQNPPLLPNAFYDPKGRRFVAGVKFDF